MAEVGLLPFARVALQVATVVLPPYRSGFSKHQFTQPQLLAAVPDAIRGLDLPRNRSVVEGAWRVAPGVETAEGAGLHDVVSFPEAIG